LIPEATDNPPYHPAVYRAVYQHLLQHRHVTVLVIDELFQPTHSPYELENVSSELTATPEQVQQILAQLETQYTQKEIADAVAKWYEVEL
jgi:hypothetical protein